MKTTHYFLRVCMRVQEDMFEDPVILIYKPPYEVLAGRLSSIHLRMESFSTWEEFHQFGSHLKIISILPEPPRQDCLRMSTVVSVGREVEHCFTVYAVQSICHVLMQVQTFSYGCCIVSTGVVACTIGCKGLIILAVIGVGHGSTLLTTYYQALGLFFVDQH